MRRAAASALLCALVVMGVLAPSSAAEASSLYIFGHSYTNGEGLADPSTSYPRLVADERHYFLHPRGVNGSLVHEAAERLYGTGLASWGTGTAGDVLIQANLNTARDFGVNALALATSRSSMRVMLATVNASRRIEDSNPSNTYGGSWHTRKMSWVSGGAAHVTARNNAYVQFKAAGGEYVSVRGVPGAGIGIRVSDRTAGSTFAHIKTGGRVHRAYDHDGIPLIYRIPASMAGHVIRLTKESGTGTFTFDARLPQRRLLNRVILVKEPHLADYSLSTSHPYGSDASIDAFNHVLDLVALEFPNAMTVDLNRAGWDPATHLQPDGVHPNEAGSKFIADTIEMAYSLRKN